MHGFEIVEFFDIELSLVNLATEIGVTSYPIVRSARTLQEYTVEEAIDTLGVQVDAGDSLLWLDKMPGSGFNMKWSVSEMNLLEYWPDIPRHVQVAIKSVSSSWFHKMMGWA